MSAPTAASPPDTQTTDSWYPMETKTFSGPLLVATDGSTAGQAAFIAASLIAPKLSSSIDVLVVVEPLPVVLPDPSIIAEPLVASPALLDTIREGIVGQVRALAKPGLDWRVMVEYGRPSSEIVDEARENHAQLIVIGLVHHGVMDRILDGDTALDVVRHSQAPVLLASSDWKTLPKIAVFAVDFSRQSMVAARAGLRILDEGATVILAHVRPAPTVYDGMGMWELEYEEVAKKELRKFEEALNAPPGIRIVSTLLRGSAPAALLALADTTGSDLVVAGTRGAGLIQRLLIGSVATRLIRHSTRSLLIVPDKEK